MKTSASALETCALCARKWKFQYGMKLPSYQKHSLTKGIVLHACCERALKGQDPFPDGWQADPQTGESVSPGEAQIIHRLVQTAQTAGYLEPRHDSRVEEWFEMPMLGFRIVGKKDHETAVTVDDHKSAKSRRYLKSPASLRKTLQMMVYALDLLLKSRKRGEVDPPVITLAHNQFVLDPGDPLVKRVEAEVTPAEIEAFRDEVLVPILGAIRNAEATADPFEIPDPPADACAAYGGCGFLTLCTGTESIETYSKRIQNMQKNQKERKVAKSLDDFMAKKNNKPAAAAPVVNPPAPAPAPALAPAPAPAPAANTPPWFSTKCPKCKTSPSPGWNLAKKDPCPICKGISRIDSSAYEWEISDGSIVWWKKGEKRPVAQVAAPAVVDGGKKTAYCSEDLFEDLKKAKTTEEAIAFFERADSVFGTDDSPEKQVFFNAIEAVLEALSEGPKEEPKAEGPKEEPKEEPKAEAPKSEPRKRRNPQREEAPAQPASSAVVPVKGLTLMIACAPLRPCGPLRTTEQVLTDIEGYWNDAPFDRRDKLRKAITTQPDAREALVGQTIVQIVRDPDSDNLMSCLIPFAEFVIRNTGV